jgi:exodeoxyribonuclease V alpha subunit
VERFGWTFAPGDMVMVGQKKAVAVAVRNVSGRRRWSKLAEWLSADSSKKYALLR